MNLNDEKISKLVKENKTLIEHVPNFDYDEHNRPPMSALIKKRDFRYYSNIIDDKSYRD